MGLACNQPFTMHDIISKTTEAIGNVDSQFEDKEKPKDISSPKNVMFFLTQDQYRSLWQPKQLFISGYGTGKTIIMVEAAKDLAREGHKVLFIVGSFYGAKRTPSILCLKLNKYFREKYPSVEVLDEVGLKQKFNQPNGFSLLKALEAVMTKNPDLHIFVDEFHHDSQIWTREMAQLKNLFSLNPEKYFWDEMQLNPLLPFKTICNLLAIRRVVGTG